METSIPKESLNGEFIVILADPSKFSDDYSILWAELSDSSQI